MTPLALFIAYVTIVRKEFYIFIRNWKQALVPPIINITLYYIIFGHLMASSITSSHQGISYIQFILPGLVVMSLIMSSFAHTVSSFYNAKSQKTIEEILVTPTPYWLIIAGFISGGMIRGLVTGGLVFLIASGFVEMHFGNVAVMIIFAILTVLLFSLIGLLNALLAENLNSLSVFPTFFLTPLTYLGGIFYSISILPPMWQYFSHINPVFYMVDGFRYGVYGLFSIDPGISMMVLLILNILFFGIVWYMFSLGKGLRIQSFHY